MDPETDLTFFFPSREYLLQRFDQCWAESHPEAVVSGVQCVCIYLSFWATPTLEEGQGSHHHQGQRNPYWLISLLYKGQISESTWSDGVRERRVGISDCRWSLLHGLLRCVLRKVSHAGYKEKAQPVYDISLAKELLPWKEGEGPMLLRLTGLGGLGCSFAGLQGP